MPIIYRILRIKCAVLTVFILSGCIGSPKSILDEELPEYMKFGRDPRGKIVTTYKIGQPYEVSGIWHYPSENFGYREEGLASWYGPGFHGKQTANGEKYDMNALTAAHKTLPMPSVVKVTNLENNKTLKVRINDRGPFLQGRIIDLSSRAADILDIKRAGTARVVVELIPEDTMTLKSLALDASGTFSNAEMPETFAAPMQSIVTESLKPLRNTSMNSKPIDITKPSNSRLISRELKPSQYNTNDRFISSPVISPMKPGFYIQAGAFSDESNAKRLEAQISHLGNVFVNVASIAGQKFHRVRLGPIVNRGNAERLLSFIRNSGYSDARIFAE